MPVEAAKLDFGAQNPGQKPSQKSGQKSYQPPAQKSGRAGVRKITEKKKAKSQGKP